jgi:hypothetical protein
VSKTLINSHQVIHSTDDDVLSKGRIYRRFLSAKSANKRRVKFLHKKMEFTSVFQANEQRRALHPHPLSL